MPVKNCNKKGKPGYKWGDSGTCYTYTPGNEKSKKAAKAKAHKQGAAIKAHALAECVRVINKMITLEEELDGDWHVIRDKIYMKVHEFIEDLRGDLKE